MDILEAIEVVNRTQRRDSDPPLLASANCDRCGATFAMLPQDSSRADLHGLKKICRLCIQEYRRESRRKPRA